MEAKSGPKDPNWSHKGTKMTPKGTKEAPKGYKSEPKVNKNATKSRYSSKVEKGTPFIYFWDNFWILF